MHVLGEGGGERSRDAASPDDHNKKNVTARRLTLARKAHSEAKLFCYPAEQHRKRHRTVSAPVAGGQDPDHLAN